MVFMTMQVHVNVYFSIHASGLVVGINCFKRLISYTSKISKIGFEHVHVFYSLLLSFKLL